MKKKLFPCFSLALARFLTDNHFQIVKISPNRDKPWMNVFYFEDSDNLQLYISNRSQRFIIFSVRNDYFFFVLFNNFFCCSHFATSFYFLNFEIYNCRLSLSSK